MVQHPPHFVVPCSHNLRTQKRGGKKTGVWAHRESFPFSWSIKVRFFGLVTLVFANISPKQLSRRFEHPASLPSSFYLAHHQVRDGYVHIPKKKPLEIMKDE